MLINIKFNYNNLLEMSKKKHNIAYIKPEEPKFIRELKAQIGFKEGPDINTKVLIYLFIFIITIKTIKSFMSIFFKYSNKN